MFAAFPGSEQLAAFGVKCLAVVGGFLAGYVLGGIAAWALDKWAFAKKSPDVLKKAIGFFTGVALALLIAFIVFGDGAGSGWLGGGGPDGSGTDSQNPDNGKKAAPAPACRCEQSPPTRSASWVPVKRASSGSRGRSAFSATSTPVSMPRPSTPMAGSAPVTSV